MFAAAGLFAVMSAATRMTGQPGPAHLYAPEVAFVRFLFGFLAMLPLLRRPEARVLGGDRAGLLWRGFVGGLSAFAYFGALQRTSLTHAALLNFTSVIFAPLFSALQLGERLTWRNCVAVLVAFGGIALIIQPEVSGIHAGDAWGLASGLLAGLAVTAIRRLRRTETAYAIFFYFCAVGMVISAAGSVGTPFVWPSWEAWRLLAVIGVSSVTAQLLMTFGYGFVRTADGVVIMLSQIVYTALLGALVFGEAIPATTLFGAMLILGPSVWLAFARAREASRSSTAEDRSVCACGGGAGDKPAV